MSYRGFIGMTLLSLLGITCIDQAPEPDVAREIPDRQFIMHNAKITEYRDGAVKWSSLAQQATGDLRETEVETTTSYFPSNKGEIYRLVSPTGVVRLEERNALFNNVVVYDERGGTLNAGVVVYEEQTQLLRASGPLEYRAAGVSLNGQQGQIDLQSEEVAITGPVHGSIHPDVFKKARQAQLP